MALRSLADIERSLTEAVERTNKVRLAAEAEKDAARQAETEALRSTVELSRIPLALPGKP